MQLQGSNYAMSIISLASKAILRNTLQISTLKSVMFSNKGGTKGQNYQVMLVVLGTTLYLQLNWIRIAEWACAGIFAVEVRFQV